ncbi:MAG TPA: hypothetical protein PK228_21460 [Saprospiraceae bacterium]|nr:hypothetical protein [Saprospiraceae bacterium]
MQTKTIFRFSKTLIFSFVLLFLFARATAQPPLVATSVFDYLTTEEGAVFTLELDLTDLINNKNTKTYFPGSLTTADGKMLKVEARSRGKFRRRICDIPPLKLKFSKKELKAKGLDTLNEMKLVVPCFDDPQGEDLLLREYVAYRMFERLSPYSVRARLIKVIFRDKHVEEARKPVYCLLVEHEEQIAARLQGTIVQEYGLKADTLQTDQAALTSVFEYMIGNTDWGLADVRNVYQFKSAPDQKINLIPFDFDFAGLVNAPYAVPKTDSGLKNVRERRLLAEGIPAAALRQAAEKIKSAQADIMAMCAAGYLSKNTAKEMTHYMESFFQNIDNLPIEKGKGKGSLR